jgi:adenine-specific DNA-methyltransferase
MDKLKMHTINLTKELLEILAKKLPHCFVETKNEKKETRKSLDFDQLRQELSDSIVEGYQERYMLNWPGKREALLTANAPVAKTLRPCREESVNFDTTENLFIEGDNLDALKLMQETYLGKIKMIYIDPPYNTGNDFVYEDDFAENTEEFLKKSNQKDKEGNRLVTNTDSNGRFHSDWLSMMYPRLKLARNLLADDGAVCVSIGNEEIFNLRLLLNEIFGYENHRNTIIIRRYDKNLSRQFMENGLNSLSVGFEYIIIYAKSRNFTMNPVFREASLERQSKGYWKGFWNAPNRPTMRYHCLGVKPESGQWKWKEDTAQAAIANYIEYINDFENSMSLEEYWGKTGKIKKFIRRNPKGSGKNQGVEHWIPPSEGVLRTSNWIDILASESLSSLKISFDNPKNESMIKTLLELCSDQDSIILDFFAGSATTAHAVMQLNAEDGGNRKFIMVQLPEVCDEKSEAFKAGYKTIAEIGKERIRRAGKKIKEENGLTSLNLDTGFRVFKVDSSNMQDVYYNPDDYSQDLLSQMTDNIKTDRTDEDLLYQVLLDWGVDLTLPITKKNIMGCDVFFVSDNALLACFAKKGEISEDFCKELTKYKPLRVVFRDSGFKDDSMKINVEQIFKLLSPTTEIKTI